MRGRVSNLSIVFFLLLLALSGKAVAEGGVLLVSSYHPGFPTFFQQTEGILKVLAPAGVSLDVEFMDSKRFHTPNHVQQFRDLLKAKLTKLPAYDVVMAADDNAFDFVVANRALFRGAPLIFFGVNNAGRARAMGREPDITGVIESSSILKTASLAKTLTGSRTILVVTDSTTSGQSDLRKLQARSSEYPDMRFIVLDLSRTTYASLLSRLDDFSVNTPLLLLSAYRDRSGKRMDFQDSLKLLLGSGHPIFHMWEHGLGAGVVGGKIISHEHQGMLAAGMALDIIRGRPVAKIPVMEGEQANRIVIDHDALVKHGLTVPLLGEKAEILNEPISFLTEYAMIVLPTVLVVLALVGTVGILWVAYARTKGRGRRMRREAEAFKALFYDNHSCMLLIEPESGKIRDANNAAVAFYGYSRNVLTSLHITDINALSSQDIRRNMAEAEARKRRSFQFIHRLADGQERHVEVYSGPVVVRGEHMLYSIVHDVTERVLASSRLTESEERLRAVFESARDFIFIKDARRRYVAVNPVMEKEFGSLNGKNDTEVFGQFHNEEIFDDEARVLSGQTVDSEVRLPINGSYRFFETIKTPLFDEQGRVVGMCGIARDVTRRRKRNEEHKRALEAAEAANKAKDQFLANISHELRTPLNGVFGMLQLLERTSLQKEQLHYVGLAMMSSRNLLRIINDILDFSTLRAGEVPLMEQEFDLCAMVRAVADSYSSRLREKKLPLEVSLDPGIPHMLVGDEGKLHQILSNVLGNAVKYTENGSIEVSACALGGNGAGRYLITVEDSGIGIPEDKLNYVFEAFSQVDDSDTRKYQGAGLGLGIVRYLVKLLGGTLSLVSAENEGTTVYISLPFAEVCASERGIPESGEDRLRRPMHVLVVDDDMLNLKMTERILDKLGHSAALAINGQEALSRIREQYFDAVLMDIQMPVLDGLSATRAIRDPQRYGAKASTPIIALTAHAMHGDKERFLQAGMNGYLPKPVSLADLDRELARVSPGARDN
jgi:PAS domain S-box-containing protein